MAWSRLSSNRWLVLGRAGLDLYADPPGARVDEASRFSSALGGSAANIAVGIVKLGGTAALLTTLSSDAVGQFVINQLRQYGVGTEYLRVADGGARTSLALVASRNDDTQSVIYRNAAADFQLTSDQVAAASFESFGGLIVTGTALAAEPSREATFLAAKRARAGGAKIVFDIDYRPYSWSGDREAADVCGRLAAASDIVIGNDEEFDILASGEGGMQFARDLSRRIDMVVYKMGARGARTFQGETVIETPVFPVAAMKPTGAGDAFLAGLATGLALGFDLEASLRRGAAAAAIVVTRVGCAPASPTSDEIAAFLSQRSA